MSAARKWSVVALLSLGMVVANLDRLNLSIVLALDEFRRAFGVTDLDRGLLNSSFFWVYALMQVPAGWLVDRLGVKYPYAIGFAFWCAVSAATGMAHAIWQIVALRILLGIGEAVVQPSSLRWIRFHFEEKQRGLPISLYLLGTKIGPAIGAPVCVMLIGAFNWRLMFVVLGLGGLIWLVFWLLLARDDDRGIGQSSAERANTAPVTFARVLASPAMWGILIGTFCYNYFWFFCLTWLPAYFVEQKNLSLSSMGTYTMISFVGQGLVLTAAGWLSDRLITLGWDPLKVRKRFIIAGMVLGCTEIIGVVSSSRSIAVFFAVFSLSALGIATANKWALTQTLIPGAAIGRVVGLQNTAANLSGVAAPLITGWLKHRTGGYAAPMHAIWVILLIGIVSYIVLVRREYAPAIHARPS
ncbi:MAG: MFS transporter [Bryobacteraceae bacterium]|jgi:MFS family permease